MKFFWKVTLLFFIIHLSGGLLLETSPGDNMTYASLMGLGNFTLEAENSNINQTAINDVENNKFSGIEGSQGGQTTSADWIASAFGRIYNTIFNIVGKIFTTAFPIFNGIYWIASYLMLLGVPPVFANAFFSIVIIMEGITIYEFISGKDIVGQR